MLKAKDKIFTNLFGDQSYSLREAQSRGDWDQTIDFIKKGSDWIKDTTYCNARLRNVRKIWTIY